MEFKDRFKTYSNTALLRIIDNPEEYQPKAVETTKSILADRQLTQEEVKIAKDELEVERQEKLYKEKKKRAVEEKIKNTSKSILDNINPIQKEIPTTEKTIRIISLVFGGMFLLSLFREFGMIILIIADFPKDWDLSVVLYFLYFILLSTATYFFYKKKKRGWLLLTIFLTYSAVSNIVLFIWAIEFESYEDPITMFLHTPSYFYLLVILFFAGTIWAICRENIRSVYAISKKTMILTISITATIVGLGFIILF